MAKKTFYFPHDSNARNDDKIIAVRMRHKMEGYGVYFAILERILESSNYMCVKDYNLIAFDLHVSSELIRGIIENFGLAVREQLQTALNEHRDPLRTLKALGPTLLRFTTDEHAITMNRAAVIDSSDTGVLAKAIDEVARDGIYPLICALMQRLVLSGVFASDVQPEEAAQTYVALLFGESQLRQALGNLPPFGEQDMVERSERAFRLTCKLYRVSPKSRA